MTVDKIVMDSGTFVQFTDDHGIYQFKVKDEDLEKADDAQIAIAQVLYDARKQIEAAGPSYRELRAAAYPKIQDQLDMQYWDTVNGTHNWTDTIEAIKLKYPKP